MKRISRTTATAAAVLVALAACGQAEDNRGEPEGDIRGVEELGNPNLAALNSGDAVFVAATGKLTVTLGASETAVIVSKRAADGAVLLNGVAILDSLKAATVLTSAIKWIVVTAGADSTTVIFDYFNGTFAPGIKPVSPALFGASSGTQVVFGTHATCAFKLRGTSGNDTIYAGQDTASTPNVLISFSGTNPDIQVAGPATTTFGFSLGAGNDVFDATNAKGGTNKTLSFAVSVHGGAGNDTIIGGAAADTIWGDEGLNTIDESTGQAATPFVAHVADTVYGLTTATTVTGTNSTTVSYANWSATASAGVTVRVAHLATALIGGVTDNVDDTVGVVVGSPLADILQCSQLTDVPCVLEGGVGDDTLIPGLSVTNTEYLYGGDGNDTFAMNLIGNKVALIGGNISDITTTKNLYTDTVDYSGANSGTVHPNATIDMNGTAPTACNLTTSTTIPPCPGTADTIKSGLVGTQNTDVRNDITVAKCPTGINSATSVCTVHGNANGNKIYSGYGADLLTGGTNDDTFVLADFNGAAAYTGGATKVITGGGGNDFADFSARTAGTTIRLDCVSGTCANSGAQGETAADATAVTSAAAGVTTATTDTDTLVTDYTAVTSPTADDTAEEAAAEAVTAAASAASTAIATAHSNPNSASDAAAVPVANTALATAIAAATAADGSFTGSDNAGVLADAEAVIADGSSVHTAVATFSLVGEGISLVNINNAVCPAGGTESCAVTTNGNADEVDFSGDGAVAGSSLTCNSSNVLTVNAVGLAANCGL